MDKTFAAKLKNGLIEKAAKESRKRSLSYAGTDYLHKRTKDSSCVNVFTVATSTGTSESEEDQFVIIHIPTTQQKTTYANALEKPTNTLNNSFEGILYSNILCLCRKHKQYQKHSTVLAWNKF